MQTGIVGRDPELAALDEYLSEVRQGSPRLVVCQGEPGIGKTRLAEEFLRSARTSGARAAWGAAAPDPGAPPYWPWRQVLRDIAEHIDLASVAHEHRLTADLTWLAPTLLDSTERPAGAGESAEDRFRQFDAVVLLLRQLTRGFPWVLVFDDMHRADQPSLVLLYHVAQCLRNERLLLVVNCRDTEPTPSTLAEVAREPITRQIRLSGLPEPAVGRQLRQPFWDALAGRAGVVLNGHEHHYERFSAVGRLREFVVGTGGSSKYPFRAVPASGSAKRITGSPGVLLLTLTNGSYAWSFRTVRNTVLDSGVGG